MKKRLLFCIIALTSLGVASAASAECIEIKAGESLGEVKLGTKKADLAKLKLEKGESNGIFDRMGIYDVYNKDDKGVSQIAVHADNLACLKHKGAKMDARKANMEEIAAFIGGCGLFQANIGANVIKCGGGVTVIGSRGGIEVRVSDRVEPPKLVCDGYVSIGAPKSKTNKVKVEAGKTYCVGTRLITQSVKPDDLTAIGGELRYNTCNKIANRGATVVECPFQGVKFIFGGPELVLSRVESMTMKQ